MKRAIVDFITGRDNLFGFFCGVIGFMLCVLAVDAAHQLGWL